MVRKRSLAFVVLAGSLVAMEGVAAQACLGIPDGSRGAFLGSVQFPENAKTYGVSGIVGAENSDLYFGGGFGLTSFDYEGSENLKSFSGTAAVELGSVSPDLSLCPVVGVGYSWVEDLNVLSVPLGVGLGTTVPLGENGSAGLTPYAMPQFLWERATFMDESDSETYFGVVAGANVNFDRLLIGAFVTKIFEEGADAVFGIQGGLTWW